MNRMQFIVCALMALFAVGAIAAAGASASEGIFKDGTETPAIGATAKIKNNGNLELVTTVAKNTVKCTSVEGEGTVNAADRVEFPTVTFKGCNNETAGKCTNEGLAAGEIRTKELSLLLGLEKPSGSSTFEPALLIGPLKGVSFVCGSGLTEAKIKVTGCFVALINAEAESSTGWLGVGKEGKVFETEFKQKEGIQEGANAAGEMEFRDTPTSPIVKDRLLANIESLIEKASLVSAEQGKGSLTFSEAVSIHA